MGHLYTAKSVKETGQGARAQEFPSHLFKVAAEMSNDGMIITHNGLVLLANKQLFDTFGFKREHVIGQNLLKYVHVDDYEKAKGEMHRNRKVVYEVKALKPDGTMVYAQLRAHPVVYKNKKCRLLIIRDVTVEKLRENRFKNYYNMINTFPEAVFIHDGKGKILMSNIKGNRLMGVKSAATLVGTNVLQHILPEYEGGVREDKAKIAQTGVATGRFVRIKVMGRMEPKNVELSVTKVEWEGGPAIMAICHDTALEVQIEKGEMTKQVVQSVNEHLQWRISEHKRMEDRLKKLVQEKELLLKEVNHRVKNNLQIVTSILNLQSSQVTDKKIIPFIRDFQNRFYALSSIYSTLYHINGSREEIDFSEYLKGLINNLFVSYLHPEDKITMACKSNSTLMDYDQAITCGMIVNELVSNAIKHAFPDDRKGCIEINLTCAGKKAKLEISDNGIGDIEVRKMHNTPTPALGLQLVEGMVTQLKKASLTKTANKQGTQYIITFEHR